MKANRTKPKKSTLYLVRTKASEQADFPGVNTPLNYTVKKITVKNLNICWPENTRSFYVKIMDISFNLK